MKRLRLTSLFIVVLTLCGVGAFGQSSLLHLLDYGVKNYPGIKAKIAERESYAKDVSAARSEYMPKITAQHQYTYATSNSLAGAFYPNPAVISPSGSIRSENIGQATWGSYTSALIEWNIFNFGKISGNIQASKKMNEAATAAYEHELLQHKVKIADAYLLTLMYGTLAGIQEVNLRRAETFHNIVNAGVSSGMRAGVDSALAAAELVKAKLLLLEAIRQRKAQLLRLQELAGIPSSEELRIDSMDFFSALPHAFHSGEWQPQANPIVRYYQLRSEASHARSVAVRRSFLPSVTLVGAAWARGSGISAADDSYHTDFGYGTEYRVHNYLVGISTHWTISDYVGTRQRFKSEEYRSVRDRELFNEQVSRVSRQLRESEMQYDVSIEQAIAAPVQLEAAQDAYEQASARYESGFSDLPTLMQSLLTLNRAEADRAIAYINAWRSLLAIAAARGDFSIFQNAIIR